MTTVPHDIWLPQHYHPRSTGNSLLTNLPPASHTYSISNHRLSMHRNLRQLQAYLIALSCDIPTKPRTFNSLIPYSTSMNTLRAIGSLCSAQLGPYLLSAHLEHFRGELLPLCRFISFTPSRNTLKRPCLLSAVQQSNYTPCNPPHHMLHWSSGHQHWFQVHFLRRNRMVSLANERPLQYINL